MTRTTPLMEQVVGQIPKVSAIPAPSNSKVEELGELERQLAEVVSHSRSRSALIHGLFGLVSEKTVAQGCIAFEQHEDQKLRVFSQKLVATVTISEESLSLITDSVKRTSEGPQSTSLPLEKLEAYCWPVQGNSLVALVILVRKTDSQSKGELAGIAQLVASQVSNWHRQQQALGQAGQLTSIAAILELVQRVECSEDLEAACFTVVASLQEHLRCEQVALGLSFGGQVCEVKAISGVGKVDPYASSTFRFKSALDECLVRRRPGSWPPATDGNAAQLLAHKKLAVGDRATLTVPLTTIDGRDIGALAIVGERQSTLNPQVSNFLRTLGEPLGAALSTVHKLSGGRFQRAVRKLTSFYHSHRRRHLLAGIAIFVLTMLFPVPYKIGCGLLAEPVERRFCVAPHEGLLENTFAEPGDVVTQGDLLAKMDGRELRWEIAGVAAELSRAAKRRDTHMAGHETPEALLAELEMKQAQSRSELLDFRASNLEIRAPRDGIVLAGSLDRRENYPVSKGQVLYEIAPLDRVRVEIAVPASDVNRVESGMEAVLRFEGLGRAEFAGQVKRIRPRAEIRDGKNVFVAELEIPNPDRSIRPGMKGYGKVISHRRPLAWNWFHRAWEKLASL